MISVIIPTIKQRRPLLNSLFLQMDWLDWPRGEEREIIVEENEMEGFSIPVNRGISKSCGDRILIIDDDIVFSNKKAIVYLYEACEENTIVGVSDAEQRNAKTVPFGFVMIHRSVIDRVGKIDEGFVFRAEDREYCLRSRGLGCRIVRLNRWEVGAIHIESIYPAHALDRRYKMNITARNRIIKSDTIDEISFSGNKMLWHGGRIDRILRGEHSPPVHLQIDLTLRCNLKCGFCITNIIGNPKDRTRDIQFDELINCVRSFSSAGGRAIQFTGGGEPTVHPKFADIIREASGLGLEIGVVTNGSNWKEGHLEIIPLLTWIRISVDSGTKDVWKEVHGVGDSAYIRHRETVRELRKWMPQGSEKMLGASFIICRENWRDIEAAAKQAEEDGLDYIRYSWAYTKTGSNYHKSYADKAIEAIDRAKSVGIVVLGDGGRFTELSKTEQPFNMCGYQMLTTVIGADGKMYPCCTKKYVDRFSRRSIYKEDMSVYWSDRGGWAEDKNKIVPRSDCKHPCWMRSKNEFFEMMTKPPAHVNFV